MRIELLNNRYILCGHILSRDFVRAGQAWAPASGGDYEVTIVNVHDDGWVTYMNQLDGDALTTYTKDSFAFQCRYCLVIDKVKS